MLSMIKIVKSGSDEPEHHSLDLPASYLKDLFVEIHDRLDMIKGEDLFCEEALPNCILWEPDQRVFITGDHYNGKLKSVF